MTEYTSENIYGQFTHYFVQLCVPTFGPMDNITGYRTKTLKRFATAQEAYDFLMNQPEDEPGPDSHWTRCLKVKTTLFWNQSYREDHRLMGFWDWDNYSGHVHAPPTGINSDPWSIAPF